MGSPSFRFEGELFVFLSSFFSHCSLDSQIILLALLPLTRGGYRGHKQLGPIRDTMAIVHYPLSLF
jgi:hypothetical protein